MQHALAFRRGVILDALKQFCVTTGAYFGMAKFPLVPAFDLAAQGLGNGIHAKANAEHRNPQFKHRLGRTKGFVFPEAGMTA